MNTGSVAAWNPGRYLDAQDRVWSSVLDELRCGRKTSHWMWFVFPQIAGLGLSERSTYFAIPSLENAGVYFSHPVLGPRLTEAVEIVLQHRGTAPVDIFGAVDAAKLRSCLTLFAALPDAPPVFAEALDVFCEGAPDPETLARIGS